jgi:hypothetical protein
MGHARIGRALTCAGAGLALLAGCSSPPPVSETPAPAPKAPVNADAQAISAFESRVKDYVELHRKLDRTLPPLKKESTPQEIDRHERALAALVQEARAEAKPGDLFTAESQIVIKRLLERVFGGADGRALRASVMDEAPTGVKLSVNGRYPDEVPLSTVPPQLLAGLPKLPEELEFRFVGHRLILLDVGAHIVADYIDRALPN